MNEDVKRALEIVKEEFYRLRSIQNTELKAECFEDLAGQLLDLVENNIERIEFLEKKTASSNEETIQYIKRWWNTEEKCEELQRQLKEVKSTAAAKEYSDRMWDDAAHRGTAF